MSAVLLGDIMRAWALVAVSLFNAVLLLWLGMTLLLHADAPGERWRPDAGVVLAAGGFLLGSLFFISHAALLLSSSWEFTRSNTLWLAAAMLPVLVLPFVWYVVLLRNAGFRISPESDLYRRHRPWLALLTAVLAGGVAALLLLGIPFIPVLDRLTAFIWPLRQLIKAPVLGIPLVAVAYPLYVLLCVALSVDTLRSTRQGEAGASLQPPRRSRTQLIAATVLLLVVGVLVAVAVVWTISNTREGDYYIIRRDDMNVLAAFDFVIALLIGLVTLLLGQAMTRYELFTGKTLPRRGLSRYWGQAIALAAGYGVLLGGALVWGLEPIYAVLLTAVLMTLFFVLLAWRSSVEWRRAMRQLRPMVMSEGWYERLTGASNASHGRSRDPFVVLCREVLGAPRAYLIPAGPLASFVAPQAYPPGASLPEKPYLPDRPSEDQLAIALPGVERGGASWAVPLWSERGLAGALLLASPADGRLYSEEELEIARAVGERLIDAAASLALSQKLMALQREQMAQSQLLDQRTRRVLHDEVLPLIHTAMLSVSASDGARDGATDALQRLSDAHREISTLLRELPSAVTPDVARLGPLAALRKAVEGEFGGAFASVTWEIDEAAERAAAALPALKAETLYYAARELARNAARHAQPAAGEGRRLCVAAACRDGSIRVTVADNGGGWEGQALPGHGLELHTALMAIAGGSLEVEAVKGEGTRGVITLPFN